MPHAFGQATLSWTRNGEADLAGYRIYYGLHAVPPNVPFNVDVGLTATPLTPTATLTNFVVYGNLDFAVTAYDTSNNESALSSPAVSLGLAPVILPVIWP